MPDTWLTLCRLDDLPVQGGRYIEATGRALAVFRLDGDRIHITDDHCPHAGGSLAAGRLHHGLAQPDDVYVVCPSHAWPFDLVTGRCPDAPSCRVRTYESRVRQGRVQVRLPACSPGPDRR